MVNKIARKSGLKDGRKKGRKEDFEKRVINRCQDVKYRKSSEVNNQMMQRVLQKCCDQDG
jgi:hypothetical protein